MKALSQNILFIAVILLAALSISSCAKKLTFGTSAIVPAAEGSVKIKKDKNKNYKIDLKVIRLTDAKRLTPPKEAYIVWMKTDNNGTKNIGSINTSSSFLSKTLKSSLHTVTAFTPISFFITAEDDATIQFPRGVTVLSTQ